MKPFICKTCGTQFSETQEPPSSCPICEDERQYVHPDGQSWTRLADLQGVYTNDVKQLDEALYSIVTTPKFAIGQQAYLIQTPEGNVLWDCITLLDDETIQTINALGGIKKIAISHPHYYSSMLEWAHAFNAELYLHEADKAHVMRPDERITFWQGESLALQEGVTLVNSAGHFEGGTVLHWQEGVKGDSALFTGDIIQVVADPKWVSFMFSYPNSIPLSRKKIERIVGSLEPFAFEKIYGAFNGVVQKDAKAALKRSAERYIKAITD